MNDNERRQRRADAAVFVNGPPGNSPESDLAIREAALRLVANFHVPDFGNGEPVFVSFGDRGSKVDPPRGLLKSIQEARWELRPISENHDGSNNQLLTVTAPAWQTRERALLGVIAGRWAGVEWNLEVNWVNGRWRVEPPEVQMTFN